MAVSLLGYFGYVGVAFTAIMALLFSLFVDSKALEGIRHYPSSAIMRTVTASNEAHRRLLKREANRQALRSLAAKEALPLKTVEQSSLLFIAQAAVDKSKGKRRSHSLKSKKLLASRRNDPIGGRYPTALGYAGESSFPERRYGPFTGFSSASNAQYIYH